MISPALQRASLDDYLTRTPTLHLLDVVEDLDTTGRNFARKGIQRIIAGVEAGTWQVVLVYRYDRFGRNVRDSLVNIARVEQAGGRVVSVTEPFDASTAIGKYGRTNILAVAELQSDLIGESWKATHEHRRARGLTHTVYPRLGYSYSRDGGYTVDPESAPVVADVYRLYLRGWGYRQLAEHLARQGIRSPRTGTTWTPRGVAYWLNSGFSAGLFLAHGQYLTGAHDAIIDERTWLDHAGNFHSDALHVVERYTMIDPDHIQYEATLEDPKVFTAPWKISMPLYRHLEKNAQVMEYKCVEFVEELMYGHLRKQPSNP